MRFFRASSIHRKLTIAVFLTSVVGLSLAGLAFELFERARFRSALVSELAAHADAVGLNARSFLNSNDRTAAEDLLRTLRVERHIVAASLYDSQGQVFAEYRRDASKKNLEMPEWQGAAVRFAADSLTVSRSFPLDAQKGGGISLVSDFSELNAQMLEYRAVSALILIVSIFVTALLSSRMTRLITEPILQLASVARRIFTEENYSVRAVPWGGDEVGELVVSFNQMLEKIQERDVALQTAKEHLEVRVDERTRELQNEVAQRTWAEEALSVERERLRALIDNVPDYMYVKDVNCRFLVANRSVARQMGAKTPEELLGKRDFDYYPRELAETFYADELKVIRSGRPEVNREGVGLDAQGNSSWVLTTQVPLRDKSGRIIGLAGIGRDITQLKRAQEEMQRAREAAEAASRAKSEFLANMSHEIRTPLNGVIGMTDLALGTDLKPEQREYLETVKMSADSLLAVINDILDFSKIEAGKIDLEAIDFRLRECLETTLKTMALRADEKGLELLCEITPDVPEVVAGDPARLRQVLINLLGNAIKFTSQGEVAIRVQVESREDRDFVLRFTVADTGIGIPAEKRDSIFAPFIQADNSTTRKYGGTGLGLTISARLVAMMGGAMWVESEVGRGTQFHFTVFLEAPDGESGKAAAPTPALRGMKVLVVDDNETNRRILEELLNRWEMKAKSVGSGESALRELRAAGRAGEPYTVMVADARMPHMDGFALMEKIRETRELVTATIMMLNSTEHQRDAARFQELGVAAHLLKPIRQSELCEALVKVAEARCRMEAIPPVTTCARQDACEPSAPLRVLLAEDNLVNQHLMTRLLEKAGHFVVVARNGREVLAALEKESFDLALMDVQMPEMDGFEATAEIRKRERAGGGHLPIVALTAHAMKGDREKCLAGGMDAYLSKPIRARELHEVLERLLPPWEDTAKGS